MLQNNPWEVAFYCCRVGALETDADGKAATEAPLLALEEVNEASLFGRAWDSVRLWMK